jgi:hypothetical protein
MKRNNALINNLARAAMLVMVVGMATGTTGCRTVGIDVSPTAKIQSASDQKIALSVGLMLDRRFCTNSFIAPESGLIHPFGPALKEQSISLCEQAFEKVTVSTNGVVPAGVDATLTPEVHRCAIAYKPHGRSEDITLLLEWTLRTGDNQNILWMTTVDGHGNQGKSTVFQQLFDELVNKSYQEFQESPEIKRLIAKKTGTAM